MNNLVPQSSLLVQSLGWALLQSLWQGLLIYICLHILLAVAGKQSAKTRYILSMLSLTAMFAWFVDTWAEQWLRLRNSTVIITEAGGTHITTTSALALPQTTFYNSDLLATVLRAVQPYLPLAVGLYLLGLCFMLARFGLSIHEVKRLRRKGITTPSNDWVDWLQARKEELGINRSVQLFYSIYAKVPMTIGSLKPVVLMPIAMAAGLSAEQMEAILLHELAHIKRNDYLLNVFQAIAETVLFFNPFVWLASSLARREREHCCDDLVLSCTAGPLPYAKALAALEAYRMQAYIMTLAATGNKSRLFHRIKRIMEMKKQKNNYATAIIATLLIAALVISLAWFSPSFAQSHRSKTKANTGSTHNSSPAPKPPKAPKTPQPGRAAAPEAPEAPEPAEAFEVPEPPEAPEAMADVDWAQINKEMKKAEKEMASVDWDKINKEMEQASEEMRRADKEMAAVNWDEINEEMAKAQKEIDAVNWRQVQAEIDKGLQEARRSIKDPKVRKQVEQSLALAQKQSQLAIKQAHMALEQAKLNAERQQRTHTSASVSVSANGAGKGNASVYAYSNGNGYSNGYSYGNGISKTHTNGSFETMLNKMEHDGLIDRSGTYKVEKYADRLYINGQLQPTDVYKRYSKYLKNKDLTIKGDRDHLKISVKD